MNSKMAVLGVVVTAFIAVSVIPVSAAEVVTKRGNRYTVYNTTEKCRVVCKAPKPALAVIEDGLAYVLDLPLAILSPLTCPIVCPVMDKIDSYQDRTYKKPGASKRVRNRTSRYR